jgi:membrane protein
VDARLARELGRTTSAILRVLESQYLRATLGRVLNHWASAGVFLVAIASWSISRFLIKRFKASIPSGSQGNNGSPFQDPSLVIEKEPKKGRGILSLGLEIAAAVGLKLIRGYVVAWCSDIMGKRTNDVKTVGDSKVFGSADPSVGPRHSNAHDIVAGADALIPKRSYQKNIFSLLKNTATEWIADKCPQLGAALAYYTVFSLAPLVLVLLAVFGIVFGSNQTAREKIIGQLSYVLDPSGIKVMEEIASNVSKTKTGILATSIGIILGLLGASGVFGQLQDALNTIWSVKPKPGAGLWDFLRKRFLSFSMVGGVCFLMLVSLTIESLLRGLHHYLQNLFPGGNILGLAIFLLFDLAVIVLLFAMIFRYLPDVRIPWRDVWVGAALTAGLFVLGKFALGLYLGSGSAGSPYGAAGSLITLLLWIYYAAQIVLFGAEFTQVYANTYGSRLEPEEHSIRVERIEIEIPDNR